MFREKFRFNNEFDLFNKQLAIEKLYYRQNAIEES